MIHRVVLTIIGFVYECSKNKANSGYKLAFFSVGGILLNYVDCPTLDYSSWQSLDSRLDANIAFILIWKEGSTFASGEPRRLLEFIKEDQDPLVYDDHENIRRSTLVSRIVSANCVLVSWPRAIPPSSGSWSDFVSEYALN